MVLTPTDRRTGSGSIPFVLSREQSASDRGFAFGRGQIEAVHNTVRSYRTMLASIGWTDSELIAAGARVGSYLATRWPSIVTEIEGIAQGAGEREELLLALNARTELLAGTPARECSAVGFSSRATEDGSTLLGQNWDWHPDLRGSRVVWCIAPPDQEQWLCTFTEAGLVAKIGLNSRGVGCCMNILGSTADGDTSESLPIHVAVRVLLECCSTLPQAMRVLLNERFAASTCFNLGAASGDEGAVVSVEVSPAGAVPIAPAARGYCVHTNHFIEPPASGIDHYVKTWPDSLIRLWDLEARLEEHSGRWRLADLHDLFSSHLGGQIAVCCHDERNPEYAERQGTLASVVMDLTARRMLVSDGQPCRARYVEMPVPP